MCNFFYYILDFLKRKINYQEILEAEFEYPFQVLGVDGTEDGQNNVLITNRRGLIKYFKTLWWLNFFYGLAMSASTVRKKWGDLLTLATLKGHRVHVIFQLWIFPKLNVAKRKNEVRRQKQAWCCPRAVGSSHSQYRLCKIRPGQRFTNSPWRFVLRICQTKFCRNINTPYFKKG